jgi:uroporphyrin-III C-methyltransferase
VAVYVFVDQRSGVGLRVSELRTEMAARGSELAALSARVEESAAARRRVEDDLDRLDSRVNRDLEAMATLPARLAAVETSVQRFVGTGDRVRAAWLLAEAEHYIRIANAQLGLAGDVEVAQTALGLADDTLRELDDPKLTPVRRLLAEELAGLKAVPRPDVEGIVLTLGTLSSTLDELPLKQSAPRRFRAEAEAPARKLEGWDRAWAAIRNAFFSLVNVRRTDSPVSPLLSDAEQSVVVRSLDLELQLARLAIMRDDAGMYRRSVEAAMDRVRQNFDVSAPEVEATLVTLKDLATAELPEELPDISGSLATLLKVTGQSEQP